MIHPVTTGARRPRPGRRAHARCLTAAVGLALLLPALPVAAQMLESIDIEVDQGVARVRIEFAVPAQLLRHAPLARGKLLHLYLNAPGGAAAHAPVGPEVLTSPPNAAIPAFTVSINRERSCDPVPRALCVALRFDREVSYTLRAGDDSRSVELYIPVVPNTPPPASDHR